jgi:UDP-N-acetylmuramoyl-tripeptide--D-alanyl-D-alanine ligase
MQLIKKIVVWILTVEARLILRKYKPTIVAVTGSVGKTSTKDAIYAVLKNGGGYVRKSEKSLNSEVGLPLTIIGIPNAWKSLGGWVSNIIKGLGIILGKNEYPDTLILEVGADHPGDIRKPARWLRPHVAVITRISMTPVHVEFFKSPEEVFEEKASLAEAVRPGGAVVLFADEPKIMTITERLKDKEVNILTFGLSPSAHVRGLNYALSHEGSAPSGIQFTIDFNGHTAPVSLKGIVGETYMYPLLAAAAVGQARAMSFDVITQSLGEYKAPPGRMKLIAGINNSTIIDDTYNSSPDASEAALETLKNLQTSGSKIAVLGDMMELGKYSGPEHRKIGTLAATAVTELITVGPRSRSGTADEALRVGMTATAVHSFATSQEAIPLLTSSIKSGDIVLVKGSQSMRMEHIVKALMAEPERASELLVRQEKEWLRKI